jgi:hypothetical protein
MKYLEAGAKWQENYELRIENGEIYEMPGAWDKMAHAKAKGTRGGIPSSSRRRPDFHTLPTRGID